MPIKIDMSGNTFEKCGTAVSVAHGTNAEIKFTANNLINCQAGIVERDPVSLLATLGLPQDTPIEYLKQVLLALKAVPEGDIKQRENTVKESKLWAFVENSANAATIFEAIVAVSPAIATHLLNI
jgi:hypothetical protein